MTINDLAVLMKQGFDAVDLRFNKSDQRFDGLTNEVALNGDAVAQLIQRFDAESAANQAAHGRMENQLNHVNLRLERIEHHLDLDSLPIPA